MRGSGGVSAVTGSRRLVVPTTLKRPAASRSSAMSTRASSIAQLRGCTSSTPFTRRPGSLRCVWPKITAVSPGNVSASAHTGFSPGVSFGSGAPVSGSRPRPPWIATSTTSGRSASSAASVRRTAVTGSSHESPRMCSGFSHCGMTGVVRPMTATFTPATVLTRYGANGGSAMPVSVLADSHGKRAPARAAWSASRPKLYSWLPTAIAS